MAKKNPPSNRGKSGGHGPRKRKNESGDKFEWRKASYTLTFWILLIIVSWIVFSKIGFSDKSETEKSYSQYHRLLETEQISSAEIIDREFHGTLKDGSSIITILPFIDSQMMAVWDSLRIDYQFHEKKPSWFGYLITSILPWILIIAIWLYVMRRMQGGGTKGVFSFGKSRAKLMMESKLKVTFKDVAGVDEAKEELQEIIAFLRDPKKFSRLGGRIPKGGLLLGPPGTGKTLLARAVAGEAEVPFFSMSGADFVEMFVGVGASRVRDLFEQGKKSAPCIIFIDEIDAVGRHRGAGLGGGHDEREQTLNQLLVEMDGFESNEGVILIAATNRPDVLDPALMRPGRFDRQIVVDRPDVRGREGILKVHVRNIPLATDVKLDVLAKGTPGLAGADLANLVNEAALLAARRNGKKVTMSDLEEAKDKIMMGTERKSLLISDNEKRQTAYHETGHVLVSKLTPGADPVHKVTIIPRGRALGLTHYLPLDEKHNYSRSYLTQSLNHLLGGRAAEKLTFNELSTGAGNDIERATEIARKMVCEWGMSDRLGPVSYGRKQEEIFLGRDFVQQRTYSEKIAQEIDQEVRRIVKDAENRALEILRKNMDKLKVLAEELLEREILDGHEIDAILKGEKLPPVHARLAEHRSHTANKKTAQEHKQTDRKKDAAPVRTGDETPSGRKSKKTSHMTPARARRQLARSYGIASSRDPENRRPGPSKQEHKASHSKKEPKRDDNSTGDRGNEKTHKPETQKTNAVIEKGTGKTTPSRQNRRPVRSKQRATPKKRKPETARTESHPQSKTLETGSNQKNIEKHTIQETPQTQKPATAQTPNDKSDRSATSETKYSIFSSTGKVEPSSGKSERRELEKRKSTPSLNDDPGLDALWSKSSITKDPPSGTENRENRSQSEENDVDRQR